MLLTTDDQVIVPYFGGGVKFQILAHSPDEECVKVSTETVLRIAERVADISGRISNAQGPLKRLPIFLHTTEGEVSQTQSDSNGEFKFIEINRSRWEVGHYLIYFPDPSQTNSTKYVGPFSPSFWGNSLLRSDLL